jgi:hypothetical protein
MNRWSSRVRSSSQATRQALLSQLSNATGQRPGGNTTNSRDNINTGSESAPLIRRADRLVIRTQKKAPRRGPLSFPQRALS